MLLTIEKHYFLSRTYPSPALLSLCLPKNHPYFTGFNTTGIDIDNIVEVTEEEYKLCKKTTETPIVDPTVSSDNSPNINTSKTQVVGKVVKPEGPSTQWYISRDQDKCNAGRKVEIKWK